jgi:hypothetical protein
MMSQSFSYTESSTFTVTHARHMAAKVATDLKRIQRLYPTGPSDARISQFEEEATAMIKAGYLESVIYGFQRDGKWIEPTLRYTAKDLAQASANDDDPGRVRAGADVSGAGFSSYLCYTKAWVNLTKEQQEAFEATLPFSRNDAPEPGVNGYMSDDKMYSVGGRALQRASVRSY